MKDNKPTHLVAILLLVLAICTLGYCAGLDAAQEISCETRD